MKDLLAELLSGFREPEELRVERHRFEKKLSKVAATGKPIQAVVDGRLYEISDNGADGRTVKPVGQVPITPTL